MTLGAVITSLFTFGVFLVPLVALGAFSVGGLGLVLLFFQPLVGALALVSCLTAGGALSCAAGSPGAWTPCTEAGYAWPEGLAC